MSDVPLDFWTMEFVSDRGLKFRAYRPYLLVELDNVSASPDCFFDTGSPFCVVPDTIVRKVPWRSLGQSLTHKGRPADLKWLGLPCEMGEASITLLDPTTGLPLRRCRLVGKFVLVPHPNRVFEKQVILGMNFLTDNGIDHAMETRSGTLTGRLSIP